MQKLLNAVQFAYELGRYQRLTLEASAPFHKAYVQSDAAARSALRAEWCSGYLAGNLLVSAARAAKIWEAGKGAGALDAAAVNRATRSFAHHVVRSEASSGKSEGGSRVRLPSGTVERIAAAYAGLTKAQIVEAHRRALASISFE